MIRRILTAGIAFVLLLPVLFKHTAAAEEQELEAIQLPIIMYHEVKHHKWGKDVISPWEFESDLKYLQANNYNTVTMDELFGWYYGGTSLPPNPIMITFDDGYLSTYRYVLPLLKNTI